MVIRMSGWKADGFLRDDRTKCQTVVDNIVPFVKEKGAMAQVCIHITQC